MTQRVRAHAVCSHTLCERCVYKQSSQLTLVIFVRKCVPQKCRRLQALFHSRCRSMATTPTTSSWLLAHSCCSSNKIRLCSAKHENADTINNNFTQKQNKKKQQQQKKTKNTLGSTTRLGPTARPLDPATWQIEGVCLCVFQTRA